jgi:RNA polymerase sigma-70 factor (ECF subfamily)
LDDLPEEQRTALVLRRYEEMPYEEIAMVLDTTVPAVKSLLFRARDTLRGKLKAWL